MKPKRILTDTEKKLILALYELGKTDKEIADILDLPRETFRNILRYNNLTGTIKKNIADTKVEFSLYKSAIEGNVTAQIFWLCNRKRLEWQNLHKIEAKPDADTEKKINAIYDNIAKLLKRK